VETKDEAEVKKNATEIREFMLSVFPEDEVDTEAYMSYCLRDKTANFHIARNEAGKIISLLYGKLLELNNGKEASKESAYFIWNVVTDAQYQKKGLGRELYIDAFSKAHQQASENQQKIKAVVGETVPEVEGYLNKFGRKRVYFKNDKGDLCEVPFLQPPVEEDADIPEPEETHVMVRMMDGRDKITTKEFMSLLKPAYEDNYAGVDYAIKYQDYSREEAEEFRDGIMKFYNALEQKLQGAENGDILLLSAEEREQELKRLGNEGKKSVSITEQVQDQIEEWEKNN